MLAMEPGGANWLLLTLEPVPSGAVLPHPCNTQPGSPTAPLKPCDLPFPNFSSIGNGNKLLFSLYPWAKCVFNSFLNIFYSSHTADR